MICPKCQYHPTAQDTLAKPNECPRCGIIYQKYLAYLKQKDSMYALSESSVISRKGELVSYLKKSFLYLPDHTDSVAYWARALCFALFFVWGLKFIFQGIDAYALMGSFMHNINLPFHEFGHILFIPFGRFMTILGGSLFQVVMPFCIMLGFVFYQREIFGGIITLWWTGQSFIDVSPYIDDAIDRALPLIGGMDESGHDWGNLLTMTNSLDWTQALANISFLVGSGLIVLSYVWGIYYLRAMRVRIIQ